MVGFFLSTATNSGRTPVLSSVMNHRFGALATVSWQTDSKAYASAHPIEMYAFRNNFRLGVFASFNTGDIVEKASALRHDGYFEAGRWVNPNTGVAQQIPDYQSTSWTTAGEAVFDVTAGDPKPNYYPDRGKDVFDLTNGAMGHDVANGLIGTSNLAETDGYNTWYDNQLQPKTGRKLSSGSYNRGVTEDWLGFIRTKLGMRNSDGYFSMSSIPNIRYGLGSNSYAEDREYFLNYNPSSRYWDRWRVLPEIDKPSNEAKLIADLENAITVGGWYRDFAHWHEMSSSALTFADYFMALMRTTFGNNFVWTCSEGEALEYMFLREISTVESYISNAEITIEVTYEDKYKNFSIHTINAGLPLDRINVDLSVKIDLTGTALEGVDVISSYGKIINLGNNQYIVQVPFNHQEETVVVTVSAGSGGYYLTTRPTGTRTISGNSLTIETNEPCRFVLFRYDTNEYQATMVQRIVNPSNSHTFTIDPLKNYKVGIINEFQQMELV